MTRLRSGENGESRWRLRSCSRGPVPKAQRGRRPHRAPSCCLVPGTSLRNSSSGRPWGSRVGSAARPRVAGPQTCLLAGGLEGPADGLSPASAMLTCSGHGPLREEWRPGRRGSEGRRASEAAGSWPLARPLSCAPRTRCPCPWESRVPAPPEAGSARAARAARGGQPPAGPCVVSAAPHGAVGAAWPGRPCPRCSGWRAAAPELGGQARARGQAPGQASLGEGRLGPRRRCRDRGGARRASRWAGGRAEGQARCQRVVQPPVAHRPAESW